ncbi:MAG: four-helix bundle copper-binding protein [Bacteroidota bacterium]
MISVQSIANLIELSKQCAEECRACALYCSDKMNMQDCMVLCNEAADNCEMVVSESTLNSEILELCADACLVCAEECETHNNIHCESCAAACRNFEETLRVAIKSEEN